MQKYPASNMEIGPVKGIRKGSGGGHFGVEKSLKQLDSIGQVIM